MMTPEQRVKAIEAAREWRTCDEIEVDPPGTDEENEKRISEITDDGENAGCWVQAWIFVYPEDLNA